jgi:hypothetical protein
MPLALQASHAQEDVTRGVVAWLRLNPMRRGYVELRRLKGRASSTRGEEETMKRSAVFAVLFALVLAFAPAALADRPADPNCWGEATKEFAQSEPGALGEHASSPPPIDLTPDRPGRAGIGNVARLLGGDHPSDAAALLGASCG